MKKSIAFLPKKNREDLKYLVELILDKIPVCEMIILYGSYARGTYVSYDEREEFGVPTSFKSDYDILVINSAWSYDKIENKLVSVRNIYDKRGAWPDPRPGQKHPAADAGCRQHGGRNRHRCRCDHCLRTAPARWRAVRRLPYFRGEMSGRASLRDDASIDPYRLIFKVGGKEPSGRLASSANSAPAPSVFLRHSPRGELVTTGD